MTGPEPVSVALLTRNGEATLPALLHALKRQRTARSVETVVVDSGSTDGTLQIVEGHTPEVVSIEPRTFNHGLTRNLAISRTSHDLVVLIVQDAVPADDLWLEALVAPLEDPRVAGAFARQIPRPDASALTREYLGQATVVSDEGWIAEVSGAEQWLALQPVERFQRCTFDNVCSCIRKSVWKAQPFAATPIAEDLEWARDVLLAGHRIVYASDAKVIHSHDRSAGYEYRRTYLLHRRLVELFGMQTIPTLPLAGRAVCSSLARHLWCERGSPSAWARATALAFAWPAAQYFGARAALDGKPLPAWQPGTV